jgi:hypothetical protein
MCPEWTVIILVGVMRFALFLRYPSGYVYGDRENV